MDKKTEYMIAWREKKIRHLEETLGIYLELVNMCLALCYAASGEKISKKRVSEALNHEYDVSEEEEYYIITRREDGKDIKKTEHGS